MFVDLTSVPTRLLHFSLLGIVFLMPFFFFPLTADVLELPKQFLLIFLTMAAAVFWFGRNVAAKTLEWHPSKLDIPLLVLWAVLLVSTLTSRQRLFSLLGNYENFTWSFLSLSCLLVVFLLIKEAARERRDVLLFTGALSLSGLLAEIFFILKTFFPAAVSWIPLSAGNPVSISSSSFGLFALVLMIIALALLSVPGKRFALRNIFYGAVFALSLTTLALVGFKSLWFISAVGMFFFLVHAVARAESLRFFWVSTCFALLVASILLSFFGTPGRLTAKLPTEVSLSPGVSWKIVSGALTTDAKSFLLGSGPASFVLDFSRFRPESFNANFAWNLRFGSPYSTALEFLGATGVLGAAAMVLVILTALSVIFLVWIRKSGGGGGRRTPDAQTETTALFWGLAAAWLTMLVASFVTIFGAISWLVFFLTPALFQIQSRTAMGQEPAVLRFSFKNSPRRSLLISFVFVLFLASTVILGVFLGKFLAAETAYASGVGALRRGQSEVAATDFAQAVSLHPTRQTYRLALSHAYLVNAAKSAAGAEPDRNLIDTLLALAVGEARRATDLAPNSVVVWQQLAVIYGNARGLVPDANSWVIRSLERAIELEGTNPSLYLLLGQARIFDKQTDEAAKNFQKAVQLKPDYIEAYLALGALGEQTGKIDEAVAYLNQAALVAPRNVDALFNLGRLLYERGGEGDTLRARNSLETVVRINPQHANALFLLGLLSERQGNPQIALDYYRKVLELNPDNAEVKRKVDLLITPPPIAEPTP